MPKTAIVLCLDDQFVLPGLTTINSVLKNGGSLKNVTFVLLTTGLSETSTRILSEYAKERSVDLILKTVEDVSELGDVPTWAISTCLRLYCGDVCSEFDRILYLDGDLIILSSLCPIIEIDLKGKSAAAVVNHPPLSNVRIAVPRSRRGKVNGNAPYFNAGVVLFDVSCWQEKSIGYQCRQFIKKFPNTRLFDQDALNIALSEDWQPLDKHWNVPAGPLDEAPMLQDLVHVYPTIAHEVSSWENVQK